MKGNKKITERSKTSNAKDNLKFFEMWFCSIGSLKITRTLYKVFIQTIKYTVLMDIILRSSERKWCKLNREPNLVET